MKEIIIDGVNVAGCEFAVKPINDNRIKCHCAKGLLQLAKMQEQPESIKSGLCENNPKCHYKQHKRLQQENERLKRNIIEALQHEKDALDVSIKYKERFKKRGELMLKCAKQRERLKQTLQEIKAIAEEIADTGNWLNCGYNASRAKKILDLITKAEEE